MAKGKNPKKITPIKITPRKAVPTKVQKIENVKAEKAEKIEEAIEAKRLRNIGKAPKIAPSLGDIVEDPRYSPSGKALHMKEVLMKQPKVLTMIPIASGEKPGATLPVTINGYRINIQKGVMVNVPHQIAEMIKDSFHATRVAGQQFLADRTPGHEKALAG